MTSAILAGLRVKKESIGETGLDYYRMPGDELDWQRERFRVHIRAAREDQCVSAGDGDSSPLLWVEMGK